MLILSRKVGENIRIAQDIVVMVREIKGGRVSVGIEADNSVRILRTELQDSPSSAQRVAHRA